MAANSAPQFDPNPVAGDLSPTTKVINYLRTRGIPLTNSNVSAAVRQALEENAQDPGVIEGLRSDTAATDAQDRAAMRGRGKGGPSVGQSGSATRRVEGGNPPMADLSHGPTNEADYQPPNTTKVSSAAPVSDTGQPVQRVGPDDFASFVTPAAIASAAIGAGAIPGMMNRGGEYVGNAQPPTGRVTDVDPTAIAGSDTKLLGQQSDFVPPPTTMEQAMQEAIAPPRGTGLAGAPGAAATPQDFVGGIRPPVADPGGLGRQPLPAGINPYEVGGSANPASRTTILPENTTGAPPVPIRPVTPGGPSMRSLTVPSYHGSIGAQILEKLGLIHGPRIP